MQARFIKPAYQLVLFFSGFLFFGNVSATTLYDNLSDNTGTPYSISSTAPMGNSFSTGTSAFTLNVITVQLELSGSAVGLSTFTLWTDSGNAPGSQIVTLGTIDDSSLSGSAANYDFSGLNISLTANTRYWVEGNSTGNALWDSSGDANGIGTANEFFLLSGTVYQNSDGPWHMAVNGTNSSAVPEPTSIALLIGGLAIFGFYNRKNTSLYHVYS
jgi:hypothetical protein